MKVYVVILTYVAEGNEDVNHLVVAGTYRTREAAERALNREYEFIESDITLTVTEAMISEQWIE